MLLQFIWDLRVYAQIQLLQDLGPKGDAYDLLGTYICAGVFTMLLWQIFQNVGMTLRIMPVTGLPLPFISYGGSGLIVYFAMFGLVQSVHMRRMR